MTFALLQLHASAPGPSSTIDPRNVLLLRCPSHFSKSSELPFKVFVPSLWLYWLLFQVSWSWLQFSVFTCIKRKEKEWKWKEMKEKSLPPVPSNIWSWTPVPNTELLSPEGGGPLDDRSIFCFNEQTLVGSRISTGHQKDQAIIRSLVLSAPSLFSRGGRNTGNWVDSQSCLSDEASIKIPKILRSESVQVVEHLYARKKVGASQFQGDWGCCAWNPSRPYPMYLHLASHLDPLSYCLLYNKPVNISTCSPEVCKLS